MADQQHCVAIGGRADVFDVAGRVGAVEVVGKDDAGLAGVARHPVERFARPLGGGAEHQVGNEGVGAHGRADGVGVAAAERLQRPVEIAHAGFGPAGFRMPQQKQTAHCLGSLAQVHLASGGPLCNVRSAAAASAGIDQPETRGGC